MAKRKQQELAPDTKRLNWIFDSCASLLTVTKSKPKRGELITGRIRTLWSVEWGGNSVGGYLSAREALDAAMKFDKK